MAVFCNAVNWRRGGHSTNCPLLRAMGCREKVRKAEVLHMLHEEKNQPLEDAISQLTVLHKHDITRFILTYARLSFR